MGWRHLLPVTVEVGAAPATTGRHRAETGDRRAARERPAPGSDGRSPALVEALARLEVATRLRDTDAAARILEGLADTDDGLWLLRQCVAAGLREVADVIAEGTTPGDSLGQPAPGVAMVTDPATLRSVGPAA
jgi:hypothetical protein